MADRTPRPSATGQDATSTPRHDTTVMVLSVAAAAARLGITTGAVRKRLERGTLNGRKIDGQWRVLMTPDDATRRDTTAVLDATGGVVERDTSHDQAQEERDTVPSPVVSPSAQAQLDAFRDAILRPHIERIEELAKDVGRLTAERDAAIRDRDQATTDRQQAEQRLASDRALLDIMANGLAGAAERREPVVQVAPIESHSVIPPAVPRRLALRGNWLNYIGTMAALVTIFAYAGATMSVITDGVIFSWHRLFQSAVVGVGASTAIGLLLGQLWRLRYGPPPSFRSMVTDPLGRREQGQRESSDNTPPGPSGRTPG